MISLLLRPELEKFEKDQERPYVQKEHALKVLFQCWNQFGLDDSAVDRLQRAREL
jgi:hypothetical protein